MLPRPPSCDGCPANATARGFVPPSGNTNARMVIVGQGPGSDEATFGEPFIGPSGATLDRWLVRAGVPREVLAIGNVVQCQLPGNRPPKPKETQHCWKAHVRPWLESLTNARVIVPVGVPAMEALLGKGATASVAGTLQSQPLPWPGEPYGKAALPEGDEAAGVQPVQPSPSAAECWMFALPADLQAAYEMAHSGGGAGGVPSRRDDGPRVVLAPILHPAGILRGQWALEPAQVRFLKRAWEIAKADRLPDLPDVRTAPPGCIPTPTISELVQFQFDTGADDVLACDIEGTQGRLIGIGFCRVRDEKAIYVPFLNGEATYWKAHEWELADSTVRALLERPLVFHNGQAFDIPFLESCGYSVPRYVDDTMIRHHILYAEMPKGLEDLAVLYCGMSSWKWLSKVGEVEEGK